MKFGDLVEYDLRASHGGNLERAYVLGEMSYSKNGDVILLSDQGLVGMPINRRHCRLISGGHETICASLRAEYEHKWPSGLKPHIGNAG